MKKEHWRRAARILSVFRLCAIIYALIFILINYLVLISGLYLLFIYTTPMFLGSLFLIFSLLPDRDKKDKLPLLESGTIKATINRICEINGNSCETVVEYGFFSNALAYRYKDKDYICLGFPLLVGLNKHELNSVIAHELAHHINQDTSNGSILNQLDSQVQKAGKVLVRRFSGAFLYPFIPVFKQVLKYVRKLFRENEFAADAFAVQLFGPTTTKNALVKLQAINEEWEYFFTVWLPIIDEGKVRIDFFSLYEACTKALAINYDLINVEHSETQNYDTHPSMQERLEAIDKLGFIGSSFKNEMHVLDNISGFNLFYDYFGKEVSKDIKELGEGYIALCEELLNKYLCALEGYSWKAIETVLYDFSHFTYQVYEIRKEDDFQFEKQLFIVLISFLLFKRTKSDLRLGKLFTPIIDINGIGYEIGEAVWELFDWKPQSYLAIINSLAIDVNQKVLEGYSS